jgi:WD40 repeat protein
MQDRSIRLNQFIDRAKIGHEVYIMQDVTLTGIAEGQLVQFEMDKGAIGRVTIEIFSLDTGTPLLVKQYVRGPNDPNGPQSFTVAVDLLVKVNLPPTSTYKKPLEGKELFACQNITPPQFCVHDYKTGQTIQITHDLNFEFLGVPSWSPDGQQFAFPAGSDFFNNSAKHPDHKIYLLNADGSNLRQVTFGDFHDQEVDWSPDGEWIALYRNCQLWRIRPDGSDAQPLVQLEQCIEIPVWSPDSKEIAFIYARSGYFEGIWMVNKDGSNLHEIYAFKVEPYGGISWSPDGSQIYGFNMPGLPNYFLVNVDGSSEMQEIQENLYWWKPTFWPRWGGDAK